MNKFYVLDEYKVIMELAKRSLITVDDRKYIKPKTIRINGEEVVIRQQDDYYGTREHFNDIANGRD